VNKLESSFWIISHLDAKSRVSGVRKGIKIEEVPSFLVCFAMSPDK
jgi:hypothetical protein